MNAALLPERISYLGSFVDDLLSRDEHAIDESIDTTGLFVAMKARVSTLSVPEAAELLAGDKAELQRWLACRLDHPANFIEPFYSEPSELAEHLACYEVPKGWKPRKPRKPKPRKLINMELPPGFSFRREGSGFFLQKGDVVGQRHTVGVGFDKGPSLRQLKPLLQGDSAVSIEEVVFGALSGTRILRNGKTVTLLLRGAGVKYCIYLEGDSSLVEPYLHTLSVSESEI